MMVQELGQAEKRKFAINHEDECYPRTRSFHNHLFLTLSSPNQKVLIAQQIFHTHSVMYLVRQII